MLCGDGAQGHLLGLGLDDGEAAPTCPGGACQEAHFDYVVEGGATILYIDGESETLTVGQAYYIRPGHNVHVDKDSEFVEFTPADQTPGINTL